MRSTDFLAALWHCLAPRNPRQSIRRIAQHFETDKGLVCLSVRSGWNLLLETVGWPRGSEIIFSGLTIGDMPRIAESRGLNIIGADVDWKTLSPSIEEIESKITPQTRAIVVAHLLGGRCDLTEIAALAKSHGVMLIEDCAQAYIGGHDRGSSVADVSMFSFGPIKTNTALGGGILFVADAALRRAMARQHSHWPKQSGRSFAKRVVKFGGIKLLSTWPMAAMTKLTFAALGSNHDALAAGLGKSFSRDELLSRIRQQPSVALLTTLARQLTQYNPRIPQRTARGQRLIEQLNRRDSGLLPLGYLAVEPTHWVFALLVANPQELVESLWRRGFDATRRSSLVGVRSTVVSSNDTIADPMVQCEFILQKLVFLPLDFPMPDREIDRLGQAVIELARPLRFDSHDSANFFDSKNQTAHVGAGS